MGFVEDKRFLEFKARCLFFDRFGGVSPYPFDSLNFSFAVGDKKENVLKNIENARKSINVTKMAFINQIHSKDIVEFDGKNHDADGIFTDKAGVFLAIRFADCLPIVLMDTRKRIVMAIHAGWRGSYLGISKNAVDILKQRGSNPEDIIVSIGPHICRNCYEIKDDLACKFSEEFINKKNGRLFLDLSAVNIKQLTQSGIPNENIVDLGICTFENSDFFSYRRDKICGRGAGGIMLFNSNSQE
ncbi:peptidoglycan editing factor PgeF [Hippea maritima]|uniref:Purine nucleoside phosphorylase n=1 Tax=Hippea maritima (strain ATCC 700847 / DSM 10411 / MH2) TaxID=760142 RepID=F2LWH8_HIPMA|nr:peptidoglycan editing factor PgeF [Hippea maritima]AEA34087.1 Multi-copper polyphenol oxidoreductase, laccase [Hippea maritima DSM 10411]